MTISFHHPRIATEHQLLQHYFKGVHWFEWNGSLCAELCLRTNSTTFYAVRFVLPDDYPHSMPDALITFPMLFDRGGTALSEAGPSAEMHILEGEGEFTSICHYHPTRWGAHQTLYMVAMKTRLWLEAYELHLASGEDIDTYLKHMKEQS